MELLKTNNFKVVGNLIACDMKTGNRKSDGKGYIMGKATVISNIGGADNEFEISFFANQLTADGKESQLYLSYSKMNELIGKKVEVTGSLRENRYYSTKTEQMMSIQQLNGKFVKGVSSTVADTATYEVSGFVVEAMKEKTNKEGVIYRYDISLGQANYSNTSMSRFVLHVDPSDREIINGVRNYQIGQTVSLRGNLNFIVKTVTKEDDLTGGFGEPAIRTFTNKIHNFFINGGSAPVPTEKGGYPSDVIHTLVEAYKANDTKLMNDAKTNNTVVAEEKPSITSRQTSLI